MAFIFWENYLLEEGNPADKSCLFIDKTATYICFGSLITQAVRAGQRKLIFGEKKFILLVATDFMMKMIVTRRHIFHLSTSIAE